MNREDLDAEDTEPPSFRVRFRVDRELSGSNEPEDYVYDINGSIMIDGHPEPVGWIQAQVIQAGRALNDKVPLSEVCDIDGDISTISEAIYDFDSDRLFEDVSDGCGGSDAIYVRSIRILPEHRGQRLGLLALLRTIETFGAGVAVAIIEPFPHQHSAGFKGDTKLSYENFSRDKRGSITRLKRYWRKLGFVPTVRNKAYCTLDLQYRLPTYGQLAKL